MGGRVWARELLASSSAPESVMERHNFFMKVLLSETNVILDGAQWALDAINRLWCRCLHSTRSAEHWSAADRVVLRKAIIAPATATDPYSTITIQSGTNHGRPAVRRCHT